jgi:hypothetical protein
VDEEAMAMVNGDPADPATAETAAGAVQGGGEQDATTGPHPDGATGGSGGSGSDEFVVDHDADPPEEVQPTTS